MSISKNIALLLSLLLIMCSFPTVTALPLKNDGTDVEEGEPKWWKNWQGDKNQNRIEDMIEDMAEEERINIFIDYDRHPDEEDVALLSKFDFDIKYVYKYIDVICSRNVELSDIEAISNLPHVIMVKIEPKILPLLDISARAIKVRESGDYSPNTASELGYTGDGISIAVLDTGCDDGGFTPNQRHESLDDLDDNPATGDQKRIAGVDFTQDETFLTPRDGSDDPDDVNGHGTHCAGIAMGTGGTDGFYVGMAPMARLVDLRVMENAGYGNAGEIIEGIEWCIDHRSQYNIRVLSMSLGSRHDSDGTGELSQTINGAVEAGLVVVAAMGNDGRNEVTDTAAADRSIAVGSVDDRGTVERGDDTLSSFSNYGPRSDDGDQDKMDELKPDVVAYGDGITSAQANTQSGYISLSGTSMATPHVAGVVALMLEANPTLTPDNIKSILRDTAEPRGSPSYPDRDPKYNTQFGWGIVDAYKAVNMALGYREVDINIISPVYDEIVQGTVEISGTASVTSGSGNINLVEVSIDDPNFDPFYTMKAEDTSSWSVSWDTQDWNNGRRTIYARAWSGNYSTTTSIEVIVENPDKPGGDGELNPDEGPPKINLPFGLGKVGLFAAAAFVGILVAVIVAIVAAILLKRRKRYMQLIAARRAEQGLR